MKEIRRIIQKRVRKELRTNKLIRKEDNIVLINDNSLNYLISKELFGSIFRGLPISVSVKKMKNFFGKEIIGEHTKVILPWNLDNECEYFLESIFNNTEPRYLGHYKIKDKQYIKMIINITEEECIEYAKAAKLKYKKIDKSNVLQFINTIQKNHPETKHSILKSSRSIQKKYIVLKKQ